MPRLSRITLYPVKALAGVDVETATFAARGGLVHDREFAIVASDGNFINGKRTARIHSLAASCAVHGNDVLLTLGSEPDAETFILNRDEPPRRTLLNARLSHYFGETAHIERNADGGFPDDPDFPGPTVISEASLAEVAGWYPALSGIDARRRFRANLEFSGCPAFWEDRLYAEPGVAVNFQIGDVHLLGTNPCRRCVVPSRDPANGGEFNGFQRTFIERRKQSLPPWANRSWFDFYYRLAVNTDVPKSEAGKSIRIGDDVRIL